MMKISLGRNELLYFANSLPGFCDIDLSRISSVFIAQVMQLYYGRVINIFNIIDRVKSLEGIMESSCIKDEGVFLYEPLKGLMKAHFTNARFIFKNIKNQWGSDKYMGKTINKAFHNNKSEYVDDDLINYISYQLAIGAYDKKIKGKAITGEWIIFQKYQGKNYYLTLGYHSEGDKNIYKRVCVAYEQDFSFLKYEL
ncbi:hypothetical protein EAE89_19490 [Photorhabdus heterorhabditis]|uniref:hypothetical protein n=2 Tax=Photorhabdus heterorhabditis TaxID=880156 RepID=UPI001ED42511|nr:hypothetical protein [Photorhabdus heterorhabditis]